MRSLCRETHHGDMSAATVHPAPARPSPTGATPLQGGRLHRLGDLLHAVKVYAGATLRVVVLGEYGEEAGVRRR
jgi:hypothetical protein